MKDELLTLAERVEALTGPDRLTDANIHWRIVPDDFEADEDCTDQTYCYARPGWTLNRADHYFLDTIPVPRYTASLDAALSLVPEGWHYTARQGPSGQPHQWQLLNIGETDQRYTEVSAKAKKPALALVAAALRARAQEADHD